MQQVYHANANTNVNIRQQIQKRLSLTNEELSVQFCTSKQTISKWRNRDFANDASCRPKSIEYALSDLEIALAVSYKSSASGDQSIPDDAAERHHRRRSHSFHSI